MKTISQIAAEIGVSRQAVYNKIGRPPLSNALQCLVSKENGVLTVSVDGEKLIKQSFLSFSCQEKLSTVDNPLTKLLIDVVGTLREQIEVKDRQIAELTATIKIQAEKIKRKPSKTNYTRKTQAASTPKSTPIMRLIKYRK